ncbi:hypothetical protein BGX29_010834, partial [Mortierella sp. GBA35]
MAIPANSRDDTSANPPANLAANPPAIPCTDAPADASTNAPANASADTPVDAPTNALNTSPSAIPSAIPPADASAETPTNPSGDAPVNLHPPADAAIDIPTSAPANALTSPAVDTPANPPTNTQYNNQADACPSGAIIGVLLASPPSSSSTKGSRASSPAAPAESVSSLAIAAETSADHSPTGPCQGFQSAVIRRLDALHDQGAMNQHQGATTQQIVRKVFELQRQMNDRLILIQSKTKAILTQQLELAEYPIPRLFIVLPEELTKYDPSNWFRTKFRLYFICECGKHTEPNNSKVPHHLHLAKHEGYIIREPTKFFKKYGPFILLMLELIEVGTSIAGHVVPALACLKVVELADSVKQPVELVTAKIGYSLECISNQFAKIQASSPADSIDTERRASMAQQNLADYLSDVKGLEGVELRQLGSFLKKASEENLLGNLYRMTTSEGHVKWVCRHHHHASDQEQYIQELQDEVKLVGGEFDVQLGRIKITLRSSFSAAKFYAALHKAKGVLKLNVVMDWGCTRNDLEALENALKESTVSILRLRLRQFHSSILTSTSAHYNEIGDNGVEALSEALKINSTLNSLDLSNNRIGDYGLVVLSAALKTNPTLTTMNLRNNSIGPNGAQALSEALNNSALNILGLQCNKIGDNGAQTLSDALRTNLTLTTLNLESNSIGDNGARALSNALKSNSTLENLSLESNLIGDNGAQALSEAFRNNSSLFILSLWGNSIGPNGA